MVNTVPTTGTQSAPAHFSPEDPVNSMESLNPGSLHSVNARSTNEDTTSPVEDPYARPSSFQSSSAAMRHVLSPSPSALIDDPLSTEALPIPSPPHTTEAEDAFHQVFDTIEPVGPRDDNFSDSGYSDSIAQSSSTSLSSSVRDFEFENGRRYHAFRQGQYLLPNDDLEQEREDMKHTTVLSVCGEKLHFAPLTEDQPQQLRILDLGTGTGIWCVEMGDKYPSAEVIGIDLSPHQPDWVPPNVRFVVDDIESEWLQADNHYDMIHARHMALAIRDWDHVLSSAWHALKPGGWIEFQELDYIPRCDDETQSPDNKHLLWTSLVSRGLAVNGLDLHGALPLKDRIVRAGYKNVTHHVIKVPIGQWPKNQLLKKVGMYMHAVLWDGLQGVAMAPITRGLGWTREQVELMLPGVRKDISDLSIHTYYSLHVVFGQKL